MSDRTWPTSLTPEQLDILMARYYSGENVTTLIRDFKLPLTASQLIKIFPPDALPGRTCPHCNRPMFLPRLSRTALQRATSAPTPYCGYCGHQDTSGCGCTGCRDERLRSEFARKADIRMRLQQALMPSRAAPIQVQGLSLWEALAVAALARAGRDETGIRICSLQSQSSPLAPTQRLSSSLVETLYQAQLIDFSLDSPIDSFSFSDTDAMRYDPHSVSWELRLGRSAKESLKVLSLIEATLAEDTLWPVYWHQDLRNAWQLIALDECLSYLALRLREHGFEFRAGQKTEETFLAILRDFSIAHVYNLIWSAVRDASAFYLRSGVPRRRAANTIIGHCQRRAERAAAEGWTLKPYRRDFCCPESVLTSIFANVVTGVGSEHFFTGIPI